MFARADDHAFLQMMWAVDALQDDRSDVVAGLLTYPKEAAQSTLVSPYAIHRWELETLLIALFLTPKQEVGTDLKLIPDCTKFDSMRDSAAFEKWVQMLMRKKYPVAPFTLNTSITCRAAFSDGVDWSAILIDLWEAPGWLMCELGTP